MKRMFGMMPSSEVELRESYKDNFGLTVIIEAGKHGWTIMWADGGSDYKDVDKEPHEDKSSDTLLQEVVSCVRDIPKLFYDWAENFCWKARKNGYLQ